MLSDTGEVLSKAKAAQINPVTLAFVGDAVYSLYVRERLALGGGGKAADYQRAAAKIVSAQGQSEFLETLLPLFTEEESDIFRRGRNALKASKSKNASVGDYHRSTGLEAVLGFLALSGGTERIRELLSSIDPKAYTIVKAETAYRPKKS